MKQMFWIAMEGIELSPSSCNISDENWSLGFCLNLPNAFILLIWAPSWEQKQYIWKWRLFKVIAPKHRVITSGVLVNGEIAQLIEHICLSHDFWVFLWAFEILKKWMNLLLFLKNFILRVWSTFAKISKRPCSRH